MALSFRPRIGRVTRFPTPLHPQCSRISPSVTANLSKSGLFHPSRHCRRLSLFSTSPSAAAATADTFVEATTTNTSDTTTAATPKKDPLQLAVEVLRPDLLLVVVTAVTLVLTIGVTLAFPLAIGDLFDVVRQHLGSVTSSSIAATTTATVASISPLAELTQMVNDVRSISAAAPTNFYPVLFRLCACLCCSAIGNGAVAFLAPLLGERFAARMRKRLMAETLAKDQAYFDSAGKGDITARLTLDVAVVQATVADFLGQRGIRSMLEIFCSLAIIAMKNPFLAIVSFVVTPALSALLRRVVAKSAKLTYARQQAAAKAMEFATERLSNVRTVQLFAAEDREGEAYKALTYKGYTLAEQCATFQGIVEGAGRLAVNVGTLSLLALGGVLVLSGRISLGTLLAFNVYNLFLSVGLASLAGSLGEMGKAVGAMERIAEVVGAGGRDPAAKTLLNDPKAASNPNSTTTTSPLEALPQPSSSSSSSSSTTTSGSSVEMKDVWFKYQGREDWALRGLTLNIVSGSTVALVGPSGGGKSTTVALLLGLYSPQQGTVLIDDVVLNEETIPATRRSIGTVLQQPSLLAGTVSDQIRMGNPGASDQEVVAAARAANAVGFISTLPAGFETALGERGHQLSGGQQQRLSIARALVRKPRLLLLDEPTAALDVDAERAVDEALQQVVGCTKVIIAHRLSTVRRADSIAVVVGGQVVEQGSHEVLMQIEGGVYQRMVMNSELGGGGGNNGVIVDEDAVGKKEKEDLEGKIEAARAY